MTRDEAEDFIGEYRVTVRRWSLMASGMADGDPEALRLWIEDAADVLEEIADDFPALAETADALRGLRRRTSRGRYYPRKDSSPDVARQ